MPRGGAARQDGEDRRRRSSAARATRQGRTLLARVLDTPGHTLGHICYVFDSEKPLFVADTLFSIGCGRVFEGTIR